MKNDFSMVLKPQMHLVIKRKINVGYRYRNPH